MKLHSEVKVGWYFKNFGDLKKIIRQYAKDTSSFLIEGGLGMPDLDKICVIKREPSGHYFIMLSHKEYEGTPILGEHNLIFSVQGSSEQTVRQVFGDLELKLGVPLREPSQHVKDALAFTQKILERILMGQKIKS